jgi:phage terminase large subunit-like protein
VPTAGVVEALDVVEHVWLRALKAELLAFPASKHDDMVDSVTQLLSWWDVKPGTARIRRWM